MKGGLITLNLPLQGRKLKVQRQQELAAGSQSHTCLISVLDQEQFSGEVSTSCLLHMGAEPLPETAEAGALSGEEIVMQKEWR